MRILVVEDDRKVARFVRQGLCEEGHAVEIAKDGSEALDFALAEPAYDLIILDVMLPGQDGFGVLTTLRAHKVAVLDEFLARVRALLRRRDADRAPVLRIDDLTVDPSTRRVTRGDRRIELTARQYALLEYFLSNVGRVLTRQMIAQHVWGLAFDAESNVIDVYVGYLRRKIERDRERRLLHTVRGAGYVLQVEE